MYGKRAGYLFLMDIDDFKEINDRYGHAAGDGFVVFVYGRDDRELPIADRAMYRAKRKGKNQYDISGERIE